MGLFCSLALNIWLNKLSLRVFIGSLRWVHSNANSRHVVEVHTTFHNSIEKHSKSDHTESMPTVLPDCVSIVDRSE